MLQATNNSSVGQLSWMTMIGETHNRLTVETFLDQLRLALHTGYLEVFYKDTFPHAWLIWKRISEVGLAIEPNNTQAKHQRIWLDFWVRPFGCDADLAQTIRQRFFEYQIANPIFSWIDPSDGGGQGSLHSNVSIQQLIGK